MNLKVEGKRRKKDKKDGGGDEETTEKEDMFSLKGVIVELTDVPENMSREDISEKMKEYDEPIAFIDYVKGKGTARLRLKKENTAQTVVDRITVDGGKLEISGTEIGVKALEGEEEAAYLKESREQYQKRVSGHRQGGRGRRGKRFGGGRGCGY